MNYTYQFCFITKNNNVAFTKSENSIHVVLENETGYCIDVYSLTKNKAIDQAHRYSKKNYEVGFSNTESVEAMTRIKKYVFKNNPELFI
jgi:hypothetical protein